MSGNHYSKQVIQLEAILKRKLVQFNTLEAENARLKQKEWALQSCILGIEGSVAATRAMLEVEADAENIHSSAGPCSSGDTAASYSTIVCGSSSRSAGWRQSGYMLSTTAQSVLRALEVTEQQVQATYAGMSSSSSSSTYTDFYSARLLHRATLDPAGAAALLNTPRTERRLYLKDAMQKIALLLPKYDSSGPSTSLGSPKLQLHAVLDDLAYRILLGAVADSPDMRLGNMMVNLETMEHEKYPEGYWAAIALNLQLTDDQKAALKMCWSLVKANTAALTEQHCKLSDKLAELQQCQKQQEQQVESQVAQLPAMDTPPSVETSCVQKVLKQQQQQQSVPASHQQQLQQPGSLQLQQIEHDIQEVERLLFSDLDGIEAAATPTSDLAGICTDVSFTVPVHSQFLQPESSPSHEESWDVLLDEQEQLQQLQDLQLLLQEEQAPLQEDQQQMRQQQRMADTACVTGLQCPAGFAVDLLPSSVAGNEQQQVKQEQQHLLEKHAADMRCGTYNAAAHQPLPRPQQQPVQELQQMMLQLQELCKEERKVEARLLTITEQLKMQHFCQIMQFHNVLSKKQMAELYVDAWPFLPDVLAICGALDVLDWETAMPEK